MAGPPRSGYRADDEPWHEAPKGHAYERLFPYIEKVERVQREMFDRFVKLDALYDPYSPLAQAFAERGNRPKYGLMQENVIATNADAIAGTLAATEIRGRFLTDGADWSVQMQAKTLTWYAEGLDSLLGYDEHCADAFHAGSRKGTGLVKTTIDPFRQIVAEVVPIDNIIVEDAKWRGQPPRELAERRLVSRGVLAEQYPAKRAEIMRLAEMSARGMRRWAGYRPIQRDQLVVLEAWLLPLGPAEKPRVKGRRVVCVDGLDLEDAEWGKPYFPFAVFRWTKRPWSFYGIGGGERIIGHQRKINKRNFQVDMQHDRYAFPTTWVRQPDAHIAVQTTNRFGNVGVYKAEVPHTEIPPAISPETFKDKADTRALAFEEFGQSRMAATAMKPPGLDSGVALREHKDQTTQRFATQEKGFERMKLDCLFLALDCARDLGDEAPEVTLRGRFGTRRLRWVTPMADIRGQLVAASKLGRTPEGRSQFVMDMAQAGVLSKDATTRLLMPNAPIDIEAELSLYVQAAEDIDRAIERCEMGEDVVPEAYQDLEIGIWRFQSAMLRIAAEASTDENRKDRDLREAALDRLADWIAMAEWILAQRQSAAPTGQAAVAGLPAAPAPAPDQEQGVAALSPQAMQLRSVG